MGPIDFKRVLAAFLFSFLCLLSFQGANAQQDRAKRVVLVTQIVEHPALNAVRKGLQDVLKRYAEAQNIEIDIIYENAQGSIPLAGQLAKKFAAEGGDVVVGISTPSAQTLKSAVRGKTPLVFSALTDPVSAKLVDQKDLPGNNVTGVTDLPPFQKQMAFIQNVVPSLKRLGVLYNPGEANAVASLDLLKKELEPLGVDLIPAAVNRSSEVAQAAKRLIKKVDALYIPNDNTVVSGINAVIRLCHDLKVPLFAADIMLVKKGLVGMIGFDYYSIGLQTGELIQRVLEGEDAGSIPVQNPTLLKEILNPSAAEKMGVSFSENRLNRADELISSTRKTHASD